MADYPLPNYEEYEGFPQLENGVGLIKAFEYEINKELAYINENPYLNKNYIIATGTLAKEFMVEVANKIMKKNLKV